MKIKTSVILYRSESEPGLNQASRTPVAIYHGDDLAEDARNILRLAAKHLAKGDFSVIAEKEAALAVHLDEVRSILESQAVGSFPVENFRFFLQPFSIRTEDVPEKSSYARKEVYVIYDESTGLYSDAYEKVGQIPSLFVEYCDVVSSNAYDSPFIFASPFVFDEKDIFAIDRATGEKSGPYRNAEWYGSYYLVGQADKRGVISSDGSIILECVYDSADNQLGYAVFEKDGKFGLYSPWHDLIVPPIYDKINFPEDGESCLTVEKGLECGYLDTNGGFHPEEDIDLDLYYL